MAFGIGALWENWNDPTSGEWVRTFVPVVSPSHLPFETALQRKILREGQDRDSSNKKVWTEALHLLDNPRVRVASYERPKDSPKR